MKITKAVITAAGPRQRHLPLQTLTDGEGVARTALSLFLDEIAGAGVEEVALVVQPGDEKVYAEAAGKSPLALTFVEQAEPLGYGHAVWCARSFTGNDPFLLTVSDHLYLSDDPQRNCARQLIELAAAEECAVSAVEATQERMLPFFGTVGGVLHEHRAGLYRVQKVVEKPTPTLAEQELLVPGLRMGYYLCFFGMHVLTARVMELLGEALDKRTKGERVSLTPALDALAARERYFAAELSGRRFDLEARYGLLLAQLAVALHGRHREEVLAQMVEQLAHRPTP